MPDYLGAVKSQPKFAFYHIRFILIIIFSFLFFIIKSFYCFTNFFLKSHCGSVLERDDNTILSSKRNGKFEIIIYHVILCQERTVKYKKKNVKNIGNLFYVFLYILRIYKYKLLFASKKDQLSGYLKIRINKRNPPISS